MELGKKHEVACAAWAGGPLGVHSQVSMGTVSGIISFWDFSCHPLILPPIRVRRESNSLAVQRSTLTHWWDPRHGHCGVKASWGRPTGLHNAGGASHIRIYVRIALPEIVHCTTWATLGMVLWQPISPEFPSRACICALSYSVCMYLCLHLCRCQMVIWLTQDCTTEPVCRPRFLTCLCTAFW